MVTLEENWGKVLYTKKLFMKCLQLATDNSGPDISCNLQFVSSLKITIDSCTILYNFVIQSTMSFGICSIFSITK